MKTTKRYAVQGLNAEAYIKGGKGHLTHLTEVGADLFTVASQCRVKTSNMLDDLTQYIHDAPTCPACAKKLTKMGLRPVVVDDVLVWE